MCNLIASTKFYACDDRNYRAWNDQILFRDRTDGTERFTNFGTERKKELIPI